MKLKTLKKKIRKLEVRLQEGPKKLAKLKRKLEAITAANARKARKTAKTLQPIQKKKGRLTAPPSAKSEGPKKRTGARKVKRKLNLSPERRAQLAAAMNARWAAKRAAAEANLKTGSTDRDFTLSRSPVAVEQTAQSASDSGTAT